MILAKTIQCRDDSSRLKHKSIRPFYKGKSILEIIIEKFKRVNMRNIFVLTTENSVKTQEQADKLGITVFIGDEDDVHNRFCRFVTRYQPQGVIRICADNPFISLSLMFPIENWGRSGIYDYVSFNDAMLRHEGFFCEYVSETALMDMKNCPLSDYDKEHVTPYIYHNSGYYRLKLLPLPIEFDSYNIRLTVDTKKDFKTAQKVYRYMKGKDWYDIFRWCVQHPSVYLKMQKNIVENEK